MTPNQPEPKSNGDADRSLPVTWKDELLDHELSQADRSVAEQRLLDDAAEREEFTQLQELDETLRRILVAGELDVTRFLSRLKVRTAEQPVQLVQVSSSADDVQLQGRHRLGPGRLAVVLSMLALIVVAVLVRSPAHQWIDMVAGTKAERLHPGALLVRATGPVIVQSPNRLPETIFVSWQPRPLPAGTTVRTQAGVLCELELPTTGTTRLREDTEVVVEAPNQLHLVSGMMWCRADGPDGITVKVPASHSGETVPPQLAAFVCPTESVSSWIARPGITTCQSLSSKSVDIQIPGTFSCTMAPAERMTLESPTIAVSLGVGDRLSALSWQLPLLVLGTADDPELQDLLQQMLAAIGETKMSSLYVQQIRELGPAGTIPLLAYVQGERSRSARHVRLSAMQIISDLAPESARSDLMKLKNDKDPEVQALADRALQRLGTERR